MALPDTFPKNLNRLWTVAIVSAGLSISHSVIGQEYIDDFSTQVFFYEFNEFDGEDRDGTGYERTSDALRLTAMGDETGHGGEIRISGQSSDYGATFDISSESTLANGVRVNLNKTLYNNVQEYGFPSLEGNARREGDVSATLKFRIKSASFGQSDVAGCFNRRSDSNNVDYDIVNGESCVAFDTIPSFNTRYSASISLNESTRQVIFRLNDEERIVQLPDTILHLPFRTADVFTSEADRVGDVAVANLYSITKDGKLDDFSLIGPRN